MSLVTLLSLFWSHGLPGVIPNPVELDRMSVGQAWGNDGRLVCTTFVVSCPADTHGAVTVLGAGADEVERAAYVPKNWLVDKGHEVTVVGIMRVKVHSSFRVNGQVVPATTEIWIEQAILVPAGNEWGR